MLIPHGTAECSSSCSPRFQFFYVAPISWANVYIFLVNSAILWNIKTYPIFSQAQQSWRHYQEFFAFDKQWWKLSAAETVSCADEN